MTESGSLVTSCHHRGYFHHTRHFLKTVFTTEFLEHRVLEFIITNFCIPLLWSYQDWRGLCLNIIHWNIAWLVVCNSCKRKETIYISTLSVSIDGLSSMGGRREAHTFLTVIYHGNLQCEHKQHQTGRGNSCNLFHHDQDTLDPSTFFLFVLCFIWFVLTVFYCLVQCFILLVCWYCVLC